MSKQTQSKPDKLHSQALNLLRFPLAIVIIAMHIFTDMPAGYNTDNFPIFSAAISFLRAFLQHQSVPIYFFISGFVFFLGLRTWDTDKWIKKIKNRKKTLLIPYLLWNSICFLLSILYHRDFTNLDIISFIKSITITPSNYPLWFLKDLMIVVLFTPLLWQLLKKGGKVVLFSFAALFLLKYFGVIKIYFPAQGLFFFSFGAYMSLNGKDMIAEFAKVSKFSTFCYLVIGIIAMYFYNTDPQVFKILKFALIIFGLFFAFNLSALLLKKGYCKVNNFLSSASFFMYVSHALVISTIQKILEIILHPVSDISWLVVYILNLVLTVALLLSAYYLMQKYLPKLLTLLTGKKG
ncbi:MAG: acyltransferase [Bacteroidaceae bacterium]|nr:acyltransferase [Bacteroidaceae bacterium]